MSLRIAEQSDLIETEGIFCSSGFSKVNIAVFGDSIGKGVTLKNESNRYEIIKINLYSLIGKNNFCIDNYSLFGCTISKGLSVIRRNAEKLPRYGSVFLELGGNDCDFAWEEIALDPEAEHLPKTPLKDFDRTYAEVIDEIIIRGSRPVILTLPPLDPEKYFCWISRKLNGDRILKWLGSIDMIYRWQEMYNIRILMLASKLSVPVIDIRSPFLMKNNYNSLLCRDGIHPNRSGYELIYKTIAEEYMHIDSHMNLSRRKAE